MSTCAARGWPKPTVFWRKTGSDRELKNVFATKSYGVVLLIEFARDEDNGTYWCYANNTIGTALKAVLLHVDKRKKRLQSLVIKIANVKAVTVSLRLPN